MLPVLGTGALSALSSHRFLMRAALAATSCFAWIFVLQYFYLLYGDLARAFLHTIALYCLAQAVTALVTPYAAMQLIRGVRSRMLAGVFACLLALVTLGATLTGIAGGIIGIICFAVFFGAYRAIYWTPYKLEAYGNAERSGVTQELFVAFMPAIAGFALVDGTFGATVLLFAGATILLASLAPLARVPEMFEQYVWGYRESFAELFDPRHTALVEAAFIEGLQGAALLLLWPMAVFVIVGLSYVSLGLVLTATLLIAAITRPYFSSYLERRIFLHAALAASSWFFRLIVATPLAVILVDGYASVGARGGGYLTLEQAADSGTFLDEFTVLKEISMAMGRMAMCVLAGVAIALFGLPLGLALVFLVAAAASVLSVIQAHRGVHLLT